MIDTVAVKYKMEVDVMNLVHWERTVNTKPSGKTYSYYCLNVKLFEGTTVKGTYFPYSFDSQPLLIVELSLPIVVFGKNIRMLYDIDLGISKANELLSVIDGLPPIDFGVGFLHRLDVCYNHQVDDLVSFYIKPLQELEISRRKTKPYTSEGVQYVNKQIATKFYDKFLECGDPAAHGILRQESTIRIKKIQKLTGKKNPTLNDITADMLLNFLEDELRNLHLFGASIGTRDSTLEKLCEEHGELAGIYYFGMLHAKVSYPSKKALESALESHPRSLQRRLKRISDGGVPLTLSSTKEPLSPLVIDRNKVKNLWNAGLVS